MHCAVIIHSYQHVCVVRISVCVCVCVICSKCVCVISVVCVCVVSVCVCVCVCKCVSPCVVMYNDHQSYLTHHHITLTQYTYSSITLLLLRRCIIIN